MSVGRLVRSAGTGGERPVAVHTGHHNGRQLALSLAEEQNGLGHLGGLERRWMWSNDVRGFHPQFRPLTVSARTSPARSIFSIVTLSLSRSRNNFSTTVAYGLSMPVISRMSTLQCFRDRSFRLENYQQGGLHGISSDCPRGNRRWRRTSGRPLRTGRRSCCLIYCATGGGTLS